MDPTDDLHQRFRLELSTLLRERLGIGAVAASCVYPFFILDDHMLAPDRWKEMATLRLVSSILCMLAFALSKTRLGERSPYALAMLTLLVLGLLKTMINPMAVEGTGSLYFGGHALLLVGALALLPLTLGQALGLGALTIATFAVPTAVFAVRIDHVAFGVQNSLMVTMLVLLSLGCHLTTQMRFREFQLRMRLFAVRQRAAEYG